MPESEQCYIFIAKQYFHMYIQLLKYFFYIQLLTLPFSYLYPILSVADPVFTQRSLKFHIIYQLANT